MTETEKAYVAGFLDGDGCISLKYERFIGGSGVGYSFHPRVSLTNTNKEGLLDIQRIVGYGTLYHKNNKKPHKWKDCFDLVFNANEGVELLKEIGSYLVFKERQAGIYLDFMSGYSNTSKSQVTLAENERRLTLTLDLQELDKRGT